MLPPRPAVWILLVASFLLAQAWADTEFTQIRARIPCKAKRDFRCPVYGTHTRLGIASTVLQQPGGGLNITGYPITHLGSFFDGTDEYKEARFDSPNVCLRRDYCVGIAENVTFDLYVSPVKARYPLTPWLNAVPYETFWSRTTNITEAAVNRTAAPLLPPTACLPYNTPTDGRFADTHLPFQCETAGHRNIDDSELDLYSACNASFADPLPDSDDVTMTGSNGIRVCRGTVCPPCVAESQAGTDVMQFVTVGSVECAAYGIRDAPKAFVEVLLTVRNHDTGRMHQLYSLASVGRTGSIVTIRDSPLRMRVELTPVKREGNIRDAAGPILGDSIMICGDTPIMHKRLRNPYAHANYGANTGLIPVPTRRYTAALTPGALAQREVDQPAWYWIPQEDNALYGRRCGQVGAISQTLTGRSASDLYNYCYDPSAPPLCLPTLSPRCVLAGFNAYSEDTAVLAALRSDPGSDPSLIASRRPHNMPPRSIWNDLYTGTYLAAVADGNTRNAQGFVPSLVVEHVPRTVADSGYRVEVTFDIADSLLPDPVNLVTNKIYHQSLSPTDTTCSVFTAAQGGWGGLSLTFCTAENMPVVYANDGRRFYEALVVCDASVGQMASGYEGTEIINSTAAVIRFQASVGGPANTCTKVPSPIIFAPTSDPYGSEDPDFTDPNRDPNDTHYAGSCTVTLSDALMHVQIGHSQEVDCIRYDSATLGDVDISDTVFIDERPNCGFYNLVGDNCADSDDFNIFTLLIILGAISVVGIVVLIVSAIFIDTRGTRAKANSVKKPKQEAVK